MGFNSGFKGLIQLSSWRWAQSCLKHVEDSNKHIIEEIVRQVGYLPDQWSPFTHVTKVDQMNTNEFGDISIKETHVRTATYYEELLIS